MADWLKRGACRDMHPSLFVHHYSPHERPEGECPTCQKALQVCNGGPGREPCPVREQCLEDDLRWDGLGGMLGVRGGRTAQERERMQDRLRASSG